MIPEGAGRLATWSMLPALVLCAAGAGCAKRAWVARQSVGAVPVQAPAAAAEDTLGVADTGAWRSLAPPPASAPPERPDPVASGGSPLTPLSERVSEELPWTEDVSVAPAVEADCASRPCHWVQIAAPVDSFGCAAALASAATLARTVQTGLGVPGGRIVPESGLWKVQVGPFMTWEVADLVRSRLREGGFPGAWLVRR